MIDAYQNFQDQLNKKTQITYHQIFDNLIYSNKFYFVKDDNIQNIDWYLYYYKIIFIDKYDYCIRDQETKYYIICFSNKLIVIQQSDLSKISTLFSSNKDSIVFGLSDSIQDEIKDIFHISNYRLFQKESYAEFLSNSIQIINTGARKFWNVIKRCFFSFLIEKSFINSNINRIQNSEKLFEKEKHITIDDFKQKFKFIDILQITNTSKINLYYNIEQEKLFVVKSPVNEYETELINREESVYSQLCHPLIPKYYGEIKDQGNNKIIMEYINGKNLYQLEKLDLNDVDKMNIIYELMITIQYFHSKNFIYRDLKPNNIIIDEHKTAVIIDFDRMIDVNNEQKTKEFPHPFIAPEVNKKGQYTNMCDIYSLGYIIRYILTGKNPNENLNLNQVIYNQKIDQLIKRCIDENPQKRPSITRLINEFYIILLEIGMTLKPEIINVYRKNVANNKYNQSLFERKMIIKWEDMLVIPRNMDKILENYNIISYNENTFNLFMFGFLFYKGIIVSRNINNAIYCYQEAGNYNDSDSILNIGLIYKNQGYSQGSKYVEYSYNLNNPNAKFFYAILYFNLNLPGFIEKAIAFMNQASQQNHPDALFCMGYIYFRGEYAQYGYEKNVYKGIEYFKRAAELNDTNALYELGYIYMEGLQIPQDIQKGIYYYSLAAELNDTGALNALGTHYAKGLYIPQDNIKALNCFSKAANQSDDQKESIRAKYQLGILYHNMRHINESIKYLTEASNGNLPEAHDLLGMIYYEGIDASINIDKAIYYFDLGAKNNSNNSQYYLGKIYFEGKYLKKDINKVIHYFHLSAEHNKKAQFSLGMIYLSGWNVLKDENKGLYYMTLASQQNHPDALFCMGLIYFQGEYEKYGYKKDINEGMNYFKRAAELKNAHALYQLGCIYIHGSQIPQNINEGIHYFSLAAKLNDARTLNTLGTYYAKGIYVKQDNSKALNFFSRAANQLNNKKESMKAKYQLGILYYKMRRINKSIKYLTEASKGNITGAQTLLGKIYYDGNDVPNNNNNINKAIYYFDLGANNNSSISQYYLGKIYFEGKYVEKDINKAIYYLNLSAKQNNKYAQFSLGIIYLKGWNILKDENKGLYYMTLASQQNYPDALFCIGLIYFQGGYEKYGYKKDINEGMNYFKRAAELKNAHALFELGYIYMEGLDIPQNIDNGIHYYSLAANLNDANAMNNLGILYFEQKDELKAIKFLTCAANQKTNQKASIGAKYILGLLYLKAQSSLHDINKSIQYFEEAAELYCVAAQVSIGIIYYEGVEIQRDVKKAIEYLNYASSFDDGHAKNNLGVIYKTGECVEKNNTNAIMYFEEAVEKTNNFAAAFNLVHTKFYEEKNTFNYEKALDILISALRCSVPNSMYLLSLIIIDKYKKFVNLQIIEDDIRQMVNKSSFISNNKKEYFVYLLSQELYNIIILNHLDDDDNYSKLYEEIKKINLIYTYSFGIIPRHLLEEYKKNNEKNIPNNSFLRDLNQEFYEGFNIDFNH